MGMDLSGSQGAMSMNWAGWRKLLQTAEKHGWQPSGTEPPWYYEDPTEWEGGYFSNDGQYVTEADAKNIADALQRAEDELSDTNQNQTPEETAADQLISETGSDEFPSPQHRAMFEKISVMLYGQYGETGESLTRRFIKFCRGGGFTII